MTKSKIIISTVLGALVLFLFGGAFQAIPHFGIGAVESIRAANLTTEEFNNLVNRMVYITTDKTVSFVATKPVDYYNLSRFFAVEFLSALIISFLFALLFSRMQNTKLSDRLLLTFVFSLICTFAVHIPYYNWWGFSSLYTIGVALRTILGWLLIAYLQNRCIYKIK